MRDIRDFHLDTMLDFFFDQITILSRFLRARECLITFENHLATTAASCRSAFLKDRVSFFSKVDRQILNFI